MSIPLAQRAGAPEFVPFPGEHHGIEWEPAPPPPPRRRGAPLARGGAPR